MPQNHPTSQKKRHGKHHRHSKSYLKAYLPYLPLMISVIVSLAISSWHPASHGTLAYATEMSTGGLLQSTNTQRSGNGVASLQLNQKLSNAAQAKANDMIARNYWSHNTPDGQEPWVFFDNAGYAYLKAGENLAYGFLTSGETVNGWMNSPSHKANMLDSAFTEVGFGFANGNNYNNSGPETVVVAEYGKPQTLGATTQPTPPAPAPTAAPTITQAQPRASTPAPTAAPSEAVPAPTEAPYSAPAEAKAQQPTPVNTDFPVVSASGLQPITRGQTIAGSNAPWITYALGLLSGIAVILFFFKHSLALRHLITNSEKFVLRQLHHPWLDSIGLGVIILAITFSHTVGFIL